MNNHNNSKFSAFAFSSILRLCFTSNSGIFVDGSAKYFAPGRKVPSYAIDYRRQIIASGLSFGINASHCCIIKDLYELATLKCMQRVLYKLPTYLVN